MRKYIALAPGRKGEINMDDRESQIHLFKTEQSAQEASERHIAPLMESADNRFFVIPDDEAKTLTISPTEDKYTAIRLDKARAKILADIIIHQIQRW